jgi:hypothetical protein
MIRGRSTFPMTRKVAPAGVGAWPRAEDNEQNASAAQISVTDRRATAAEQSRPDQQRTGFNPSES